MEILIAFFGFCLGFTLAAYINMGENRLTDLEYCNYKTLPYKIELIEAYHDYKNATEAFIDEIDKYYDTMSGSDVNCEYLQCKQKLDSLINLEK